MISVVCFLWSSPGYRTVYTAEHVNTLARMMRRTCTVAHRLICVTNQADGIDPSVEIVPDRADFAGIASPHGPRAPACYRRLRLFAPDARETFGERIVALDLDCVIAGDLGPLWNREDDFVGWRDPLVPKQICGSMFMLRAGSCSEVWKEFRRGPLHAQALAARAHYRGSDQAWISFCLPFCQKWSRADGAYSFRVDLRAAQSIPRDARVVFFHGNTKPWSPNAPAWARTLYH